MVSEIITIHIDGFSPRPVAATLRSNKQQEAHPNELGNAHDIATMARKRALFDALNSNEKKRTCLLAHG